MSRALSALFFLAASAGAWNAASAEKPPQWVEITSPHFTVVTDASAKSARHVAFEFEQVRSAFARGFPGIGVDPSTPLIIVAVKNKEEFGQLVPLSWLRKGEADWVSMFNYSPEEEYVLVRLDVENPYRSLFFDYAGLLLHQGGKVIPLWAEKGIEEFYAGSEVRAHEVLLGKAGENNLRVLQESPWIPLTTLLSVDESSPYAHREDQVKVFAAEAWALTHYLMTKDPQSGHNAMLDYLKAVDEPLDPVKAAEETFGNLKALDVALRRYAHLFAFGVYKLKGSTEVDEDAFSTRDLTLSQSQALRGDLLAHVGRNEEARAVLEEAVKQDPSDPSAAVSMGFLEFRENHRAEARQWFEKAVALDSKSYLANFYYASLTITDSGFGELPETVETGLKSAIASNPKFAPAYDLLAQYWFRRKENLEEARGLELRAISLDPGNARYHLNGGNILLRMELPDDAERLGARALALAKTPDIKAGAENLIENSRRLQQYVKERAGAGETGETQPTGLRRKVETTAPPATPGAALGQRVETPPGPTTASSPALEERMTSQSAQTSPDVPTNAQGGGSIKEAACSARGTLQIVLALPGYDLRLHAADFHKIRLLPPEFKLSTVGACRALRGRRVRATYSLKAESAGEIIALELLM